MRVMVIKNGDGMSDSGMSDPVMMADLMKYTEELMKAGIVVGGDALQSSAHGARVAFNQDGAIRITDGPFTESKELIAGFWIWQVDSLQDAIEWLKRSPFRDTEIELRPISKPQTFPNLPEPDLDGPKGSH